ncbi:DUF5723 family protein [Cytophagaceae bacterium ABcell3]|nr:DUF5723 family protein [Cytophagaceae bacterium ABcell3]
MKNKILPVLVILLLCTTALFAQSELNTFSIAGRGPATTFANDYHTIGINPANLGKKQFKSKTVTFGLAEGGMSLYSGILRRSELTSLYNSTDRFGYDQKRQAMHTFTSSPMAINASIMSLGVAVQIEKIGGFAFNSRDNLNIYTEFSDSFSELLFMGYGSRFFDELVLHNGDVMANTPQNYQQYMRQIAYGRSNTPFSFSDVFDGSRISMNYYREYNLSYGKELFSNDMISISGGVGVKYIQGFALLDMVAENGELRSTGAFSPALNPYTNGFEGPSASHGSNLSPAGHGWGMDYGATVIFKERLRFGVAVNNIGSVTYNTNVYSMKDIPLNEWSSPGAMNYAFYEDLNDAIDIQNPVRWEGEEQVTVQLPTMWRIGSSYHLKDDKASIGFDLVVPGNSAPGNFERPLISVGGDIRPLGFLRVSGGMVYGGNFDQRLAVPLGLTFVLGKNGTYEAGFASRDFISWFMKDNPIASFSFGFLRFRI